MTCADFQNYLERRLDGETALENAAADQHLALCSDCRSLAAAADRLQLALSHAKSLRPPTGLAARITAQVIRERTRQVVFRRFSGAAIAASLLLVAILGYQRGWFSRGSNTPGDLQISRVDPPPESVPSLRTNVEEAVGAIRGIVNQTADKALEPGRILFPDKAAAAFLAETAALQPPKASMPSFRDASLGVTEFAPVAGFGRFINYFAQDIPGTEGERKSRS